MFHLVTYNYHYLDDCYSEVTAYTALAILLLGYFSMTHMDASFTPTNDTDYSCHTKHRTYSTNQMVCISCHIMPLVINSLGGRHTYAYRHSRTKEIIRNQAHVNLWPARVWFKYNCKLCIVTITFFLATYV